MGGGFQLGVSLVESGEGHRKCANGFKGSQARTYINSLRGRLQGKLGELVSDRQAGTSTLILLENFP